MYIAVDKIVTAVKLEHDANAWLSMNTTDLPTYSKNKQMNKTTLYKTNKWKKIKIMD
jgi:hypothetical protein